MTPARSAKFDFLAAIALMLIGIGIVAEASTIARFDSAPGSSYNYTWPGLVPSFHGLVVLLLSAVLLLRAARAGGWRLGSGDSLWTLPADVLPAQLLLALGLSLLFALGLVGRMPFWLAALLFLAVSFVAFSWRRWTEDGRVSGGIARALLLAAVISGLVFYTFQELFLVRLP